MKERRLVAEQEGLRGQPKQKSADPEFLGAATSPSYSTASSQKKPTAAERIGYRRPR